MKTLNLKTLMLVSLLTLPSLPALACQGGSCGGGGSVIKGMTLDSYLQKHTANKEELRNAVAAKLDALEKKAPEFARELRSGFDKLDWYMVDVPLEQLPFSRTKVPFAIKQASIQIEDNVFTSKDEFGALGKEEQAKHIVHELVRRIFLAAEGTNTQVTEGSVAKATNVIFDESEKLSARELREKLESLGYQTRNISYGGQTPKSRTIASMNDPVSLPIELLRPVSVKRARQVGEACFSGNGSAAPGTPPLLLDVLFALKGDARKYQLPKGDQMALRSWFSFPDAEVTPTLLAEEGERSGATVSFESPRSIPDLGNANWDTYSTLEIVRAKDGALRFQDRGRDQTARKGMENPNLHFIEVKLEGSLPVLEYQGDENDPVYTKFGLTNEERRLKQISIVANRNWLEGDGLVGLRHAKTGVAIPIKVHGKDYINCLKHGLEQASREAPDADQGIDKRVISGSHYSAKKVESGSSTINEESEDTTSAK